MKRLLSLLVLAAGSVAALFAADVAPQYPGGASALDSYLSTNMKYPATSARMGIEGVVNLEVTINADGSIGTIKVVRMIDPDLEQEAIRLAKEMPAWTPGTHDGTPAAMTVTVPVKFELPE